MAFGAMPGTVPVAILADTTPTTVRADLTSSVPFGHHPCVGLIRTSREKKTTLGSDENNEPSCDEPHE
jgi:hypothetical protein